MLKLEQSLYHSDKYRTKTDVIINDFGKN